MMDAGRHPNITLLTNSEVASVSGYVGNYKVTVKKKPRYIKEELCVGCLQCIDGCTYKEAKFADEFQMGLGKRKPIYLPFPQATPQVVLIDPERCIQLKTGKCKKTCAAACDRNAIDFEQKEETVEVDVGAIIISTGFEPFDAARIPAYGYGKYPNVYTGLEVERLTSASGPTAGEVVLRDGTHPKSVAIIHCVGSRDEKTNRYCSRVCCMYSLKLAHMVKDHTGAQVYNFYIDMRTPGKSYEEFYDKLLSEGVHFIRGRVAEVTDWAIKPEEEGKLVIRVEDTLIGRGEKDTRRYGHPLDGARASGGCRIGGIDVRHKPLRGRLLRRGPSEAPAGGDEYGRRLSGGMRPGAPGRARYGRPCRGSGFHDHRVAQQGAGNHISHCRRSERGALLCLQDVPVHMSLPGHRLQRGQEHRRR